MDRSIHVAPMFSTPWECKLANDKRSSIEEMRRFLAVNGYRDLLSRLPAACETSNLSRQ
jgi:hypothetical protein